MEDTSVKFLVFFICTVIRMLCPQWMDIIHQGRTLIDLVSFLTRRYNNGFFLAVLILLLFCLLIFDNCLSDHIVFAQLILLNCLVFLLTALFAEVDLNRHERTILRDNFTGTIFIGEFIAVFIQIQCNLCTSCCSAALAHAVFAVTVTFPEYRFCTFLVRQCINSHLICNHECRIETKTEVTDNLVFICLVLVLLKEICRTGESNLCNILFHFICCHTDTIIDKLQCLLFRIHNDIYTELLTFLKLILTHHFKLLYLCHCITAIGD